MSLLNPSPDDAERAWTTPGEPGAVRYPCPFDCGWFYDEPRESESRNAEPMWEAAMGTVMRRVMEAEAAVREHLTEHTAAIMLSEEGET